MKNTLYLLSSKFRIATFALVAVAIGAATPFTFQSHAEELTLDDAVAVIDMRTAATGDICPMFGSDEDGEIIPGGIGEVIHLQENNNVIVHKCIGMDITNDSGQTQVFEGFLCAFITDSGIHFTTDTHAVVTKHGVASMTCKVTLP